uniref:Uncharacterized protein n=1 Tax=Leersia perrieri TaxID=77586 RepID=A0A0D9WSB1_9ORYZ
MDINCCHGISICFAISNHLVMLSFLYISADDLEQSSCQHAALQSFFQQDAVLRRWQRARSGASLGGIVPSSPIQYTAGFDSLRGKSQTEVRGGEEMVAEEQAAVARSRARSGRGVAACIGARAGRRAAWI